MIAAPVDYESKDIYLVSNSQHGTLTKCPKQWYNNYYVRRTGIRANHFPFYFGTWVHQLLEDGMHIRDDYDRKEFEANYVKDRGYLPKMRRETFISKERENVKGYFKKYRPFEEQESIEARLAISVSLDVFPDELPEVLTNFRVADGGKKTFTGFGYRGIFDFYGIDVMTNEKALVDYKTGNVKKKYLTGYIEQIKKYAYIAHINELEFDVARIEYVLHNITKQVTIDLKECEELILRDLKDIANALIRAYHGDKFEKIEGDDCSTCFINFHCLKHNFPVVKEFYIV